MVKHARPRPYKRWPGQKDKNETIEMAAKHNGTSLATRIVIGYLVLVAIMGGVGAYTYVSLQHVMAEYQTIVDKEHPYSMAIKDIDTQIAAQLAAQRAYLLTGDSEYTMRAGVDGNKVRQALSKAKEFAQEQEEDEILNRVQDIHAEFSNCQMEVFELYNEGFSNEAIHIALVDMVDIHNRMTSNFAVVRGINEQRIVEMRQNANTAAHNALMVTLIVIAVGAVFSIVVGTVLARRSVRSLQGLAMAADRIAAGDLSYRLEIGGRDEVAQLGRSFQAMVGELAQIITVVRDSVRKIIDHAEQLTTGAEETTRATEQIAASIQEVAKGAGEQVEETVSMAAIVEQMAQAMDQIAGSAQSVALSSQETTQAAERGSEAIKNVIEQNNVISSSLEQLAQLVTKLGERSGEIGQIVEAITGIADQTELLALNAAIEAARAGEEGKGFAVVADEVRKLAEQASAAAEQIAQLVDRTQRDTKRAVETMADSRTEMASGSRLLESAREILESIFAAVEQVAEQIQSVSAASEEMAANADQVVTGTKKISLIAENTNAGTENIAAATEEQTASMEEITASAQMLTELAQGLEQIVGRFQLT